MIYADVHIALLYYLYAYNIFQKNVGRVMANEKEIISVLQKGNMMNLNVVDTAKMTYFEQLKVKKRTTITIQHNSR